MAQSSLLATLNHEGTITTFYGTNALQQAHSAAVEGDVVTLSSGTFASVNITKAITLRGAGMTLDASTQTEPTVLANNFSIEIPDESTKRLTIEGIYSNQEITIKRLKNALFLKDRMWRLTTSSNGIAKDLTFIHCRITGNCYTSDSGSASFHNCILPSSTGGKNFIFKNCIIGGGGITVDQRDNSEYKNCIIMPSQQPSNTSTYYNNMFIGKTDISNITNKTNVKVSSNDERLNGVNFSVSDDNDYKLTDEAKAIMKGTDGTEVGIYGGSLPYDPTPTNPQISKFNVAAKTTADGKLSVDIEVKSAE